MVVVFDFTDDGWYQDCLLWLIIKVSLRVFLLNPSGERMLVMEIMEQRLWFLFWQGLVWIGMGAISEELVYVAYLDNLILEIAIIELSIRLKVVRVGVLLYRECTVVWIARHHVVRSLLKLVEEGQRRHLIDVAAWWWVAVLTVLKLIDTAFLISHRLLVFIKPEVTLRQFNFRPAILMVFLLQLESNLVVYFLGFSGCLHALARVNIRRYPHW